MADEQKGQKMELWFTEKQTPDLGITFRLTRTLRFEQTRYQELAVHETNQFGRLLVLDGTVQTTEADEFFYHEMIAHPALFAHSDPKRVLIIGGGDGGVVREVARHTGVESIELVEIDDRVVAAGKEFFPTISSGLSDPRVKVIIGDGIAHVAKAESQYDVIIVDSTDPVGPAVGLFAVEFYKSVNRALRPGGILVAQTESPVVNRDVLSHAFRSISQAFGNTRLYLGPVPTYPSGSWSYTLGLKSDIDPAAVIGAKPCPFSTKYYSPEVGRAAFALPPYVRELIV
jgi:spermidine synthase